MKRILIAGCGYVGSEAARLLGSVGWEVEGWTRHGGESRAVDLTDVGQVNDAPGQFDVVVHAASTRGGDAATYRRVYLEGVRNLARRFPEAGLLFVSSTSVYAQRNGDWVTEESPADPTHESGKILREAEREVLSRDGVVARFAGVYGPGRSALLRRVLEGEAISDRKHDRFVNQLHRDDAAAALSLLASRMETFRGAVFNVADNEPLLLSDCYEWLAAHTGKHLLAAKAPPRPRKRGDSNKRVSNAKLRAAGWSPRYGSFLSGMTESVLPNWLG